MNTYKIDFIANTITITADFAKTMNNPTSAEYDDRFYEDSPQTGVSA